MAQQRKSLSDHIINLSKSASAAKSKPNESLSSVSEKSTRNESIQKEDVAAYRKSNRETFTNDKDINFSKGTSKKSDSVYDTENRESVNNANNLKVQTPKSEPTAIPRKKSVLSTDAAQNYDFANKAQLDGQPKINTDVC